MSYRHLADDFLEDREWAFTVPADKLQQVTTRIAGDTEPRICIDVAGGPYQLSFRTFNLLTVAAHDYTSLLSFFASEWPDEWKTYGPTSLPVDSWRHAALEDLTDLGPLITREGMNYLAEFWWQREQPYHNHAARCYVRPHLETLRENHTLFQNLEAGPLFPGGPTVYRGVGPPVRVIPTR